MAKNPNLFSFIYQLDTDPMIKEAIKYSIKKQLGEKIDKSEKERIKRLFENPGFYASFNYGISRPAVLKNIIISKNYAVFHIEREGGYCGYRYCNRRPGTRYYIIGKNIENNKVFLEYRAENSLLTSLIRELKYKNEPTIKITINDDNIADVYATNDKIIQEYAFNYKIDADLDPNAFKAIKVLTFFKPIHTIRVRAQGDLILTLLLKTDEDYEEAIKRDLTNNLIGILRREIMLRIANVLGGIGLNAEFDRTGWVVVRGLNPRDDDIKIEKIIKWMQKYIVDNLQLDDIFAWLNINPSKKVIYNIISYDVVIIEFSHRIFREFGNTHGAIIMRVNVNPATVRKTTTFQKIYEKIINSVDYSEAKTEFGRHKITVNALPTRINTKINTPMGERIVQISDLPLKVVGEIIMEHPEHSTKTFVISTPTVIRFETIQQDEIFAQRINKHILNTIYRQIKS